VLTTQQKEKLTTLAIEACMYADNPFDVDTNVLLKIVSDEQVPEARRYIASRAKLPSTHKTLKFWHGTELEKLSSIKKKGLIPKYGYSTEEQTRFLYPEVLGAVYLHPEKQVAVEEAELNRELAKKYHQKSTSIVLEIILPATKENLSKLGTSIEGETYYKGKIEPQYIRRVF